MPPAMQRSGIPGHKELGDAHMHRMEDVIKGLLDHLVDPLLPDVDINIIPSVAELEAAAKQVHAVVIIYNYYARKQHPELEFLNSERFCTVSATLKPTLVPYLEISSDSIHSSHTGNHISLVKQTVAEACEIASTLDASISEPSYREWPISKVSVFLVDSVKKKCYLEFDSIVQGVWSMIETDLNCSGKKYSTYSKVAFEAIETATGILGSEVEVIGSDIIYSISKEKSASCLFLMRSTNPNKDGLFKISIENTLTSLLGPLMKKRASGWMSTSAVEFFLLFPSLKILLDWTSGKPPCNRFPAQYLPKEIPLPESRDSNRTSKACQMNDTGMDSSDRNDEDKCIRTRETRLQGISKRPSSETKKNVKGSRKKPKSCVFSGEKSGGNVEKMDSLRDSEARPSTSCKGRKIFTQSWVKSKNFIVSKEGEITEAAEAALMGKRDILSRLLRETEDQIAQCEKDIKMVDSGGANCFELKIQTLIEECKSARFRSINSPISEQSLPSPSKRGKTLSISSNKE